eukprot:TRINITY_DN4832_c0_g1_i2.p1 TRINITY_DN4832_c0_g1~~TRINITY_DN4832_c0_g1_i2.p1  ORF type:complete len:695 (+),score=235.65 TRINITY_DN4832_c0_g1_i2:317-2401(+)
MPPRFKHSAVKVKDKFVAVFGGESKTVAGKALNDLWFFDTTTNKWEPKAHKGEIPAPRWAHSVAVVGKYMYLFGGTDGNNYYNEVNVLDLDTLVWKTLSVPEGPSGRAYHGSVVVGDQIFVQGGYAEYGMLGDGWTFDTANNKWAETPLAEDIWEDYRCCHQMVVPNDKFGTIHVLGGRRDPDYEDGNYTIDFGEPNNTKAPPSRPPPAPAASSSESSVPIDKQLPQIPVKERGATFAGSASLGKPNTLRNERGATLAIHPNPSAVGKPPPPSTPPMLRTASSSVLLAKPPNAPPPAPVLNNTTTASAIARLSVSTSNLTSKVDPDPSPSSPVPTVTSRLSVTSKNLNTADGPKISPASPVNSAIRRSTTAGTSGSTTASSVADTLFDTGDRPRYSAPIVPKPTALVPPTSPPTSPPITKEPPVSAPPIPTLQQQAAVKAPVRPTSVAPPVPKQSPPSVPTSPPPLPTSPPPLPTSAPPSRKSSATVETEESPKTPDSGPKKNVQFSPQLDHFAETLVLSDDEIEVVWEKAPGQVEEDDEDDDDGVDVNRFGRKAAASKSSKDEDGEDYAELYRQAKNEAESLNDRVEGLCEIIESSEAELEEMRARISELETMTKANEEAVSASNVAVPPEFEDRMREMEKVLFSLQKVAEDRDAKVSKMKKKYKRLKDKYREEKKVAKDMMTKATEAKPEEK